MWTLKLTQVSKVHCKGFGSSCKKTALHPIDTHFPVDGLTALVGANGSGKSTLLEALSGMKRPTSGEVQWFFKGQSRQPRIGFLGSRGQPFPRLTVGETLTWYARIGQARTRMGHNPNQSARVWAERLSLLPFWSEFPGTLSFGYQQRVRIASMLSANADVLLLDEPSTGFDLPTQLVYMEFLQVLCAENKAILLATHSLDEIALSDQFIVLQQGRVLAREVTPTCATQLKVRIENYLGIKKGEGPRRTNSSSKDLLYPSMRDL